MSLDWYLSNEDMLVKAERQIGEQLADRRRCGDHMVAETAQICDEVFNNILNRGLDSSQGENNSVLLLGEAGSGKSHVVEWCVKKLCEVQSDCVVLRARGSAYSSDVECLRHLATQVTDQLDNLPRANADFEQGMEWVRNIFRGSFKQASAVVVVLDQFEHFCSRSRQTLLYNLFDIAQESGVHLSIVGTSDKMDVLDSLEKRIRSRFSMRHLHVFLPTCMADLIAVLMSKLRVTPDSGLNANFARDFNRTLEAALLSKKDDWRAHLELGRPPSWFLAQCLPVSALVRQVCSKDVEGGPSPSKRARFDGMPGCLPSCTANDATMLLLDGLSEAQHIVLLALSRLHQRRAPVKTLAAVLHEIRILHEGTQYLTANTSPDLYSAAFNHLLDLRLIELCNKGASETLKRHRQCRSLVDDVYASLVKELQSQSPTPSLSNPLRRLPSAVQQWLVFQRQDKAQ